MDQLLDTEMHRMYKHHASNAVPLVTGGHAPRSGLSATSATGSSCTYVCQAPLLLSGDSSAKPTSVALMVQQNPSTQVPNRPPVVTSQRSTGRGLIFIHIYN